MVGHGCRGLSSIVGARFLGRSGDMVAEDDGPREIEFDRSFSDRKISMHGGADIAMFKAMFPPAEKPETLRRSGSSVMVVTCSI